jgi:hypothetical protein
VADTTPKKFGDCRRHHPLKNSLSLLPNVPLGLGSLSTTPKRTLHIAPGLKSITSSTGREVHPRTRQRILTRNPWERDQAQFPCQNTPHKKCQHPWDYHRVRCKLFTKGAPQEDRTEQTPQTLAPPETTRRGEPFPLPPGTKCVDLLAYRGDRRRETERAWSPHVWFW